MLRKEDIMFLDKIRQEIKENILAFTISGILIVLFYVLINHLPEIFKTIGSFLSAMAPFIFGILIALVLEPLRRIIEKQWMAKLKVSQKAKRIVAVIICMTVLILMLAVFMMILVPQLVSSLQGLINSFGGYVDKLEEMIGKLPWADVQETEFISNYIDQITRIITNWLSSAAGGLGKLLSYSISFAKGIMNFFIGLIISLYLLLEEERFLLQAKKFIYASLSEKKAEDIEYVCKLTAKMFNSFIFGKALDSLIIGLISYISMIIMKMPYAPLIAVVVGVTNMIPVFGPFLGAIPCAFLLVLIDPIKSLEFIVFILILQQVDGNIIGPHILGDSLGLPTLWVMFAIIVGGTLFSFIGMFLGVPIFSVIYILVRDWTYRRLRQKRLKIEL